MRGIEQKHTYLHLRHQLHWRNSFFYVGEHLHFWRFKIRWNWTCSKDTFSLPEFLHTSVVHNINFNIAKQKMTKPSFWAIAYSQARNLGSTGSSPP